MESQQHRLQQRHGSVTLSSSTNAKNLDLPNEAMYYFDIKDGTLTVDNWPREVLTVSIVGSTQENWDVSNATTIPLTCDEATGAYNMENVHIPKGFRCKVLKHSSLSSVADVLYGGDRSFGQNLEVRGNNSENEFVVTDYEGEDITFTGNGTFTFTLPPDFSELHIKGTYDVVPQYFLIGEFNNWSIDTKVPFARNDDTGVSTLTYTFGGEFLITDQFGNLLGGSTDEEHWWLYENSASVDLTTTAVHGVPSTVGTMTKRTVTIKQLGGANRRPRVA